MQKPKCIVLGPKKFYDFFASTSRAEEWDFVGYAENVADFWERISIEDVSNPNRLDSDFQILITVDVLYNPDDQKIRMAGNEDDNSLETLIATVAQNDAVAVMIAQMKPDVEAQMRMAIKNVCQIYDLDTAVKYWFIPKKGVNKYIDIALDEFVASATDRNVAQIISGVEEEEEPQDDFTLTEVETPILDDFVDEGRLGKVVAITSSKGGSGKSTVAILLATYLGYASESATKEGLESRPLKVCLVDLDTRDSQVGFFIGALRPNVSQLVAKGVSHKNIQDTVINVPRLKIDTILAPRRPRYANDIPPTFYKDLIIALRREYDVVILDTSVSYLDPLLEKVAYPLADLIVFVTNMAAPSVLGMSRWIRETTTPVAKGGSGIAKNKMGVVVNAAMDNINMPPKQITAASMGLPILTFISNNAKLTTHALNIQSMEKVLLHDAMREAVGELATAIIGNDYKLSANLKLS